MADSDPFSGISLSPPTEINTDNISLADALSLVLSDTNNISQPALRALANLIATKISSLTNTAIAQLSDDKIARLIDAELSRLSDDEINRLIDSQLSAVFSSIGNAISSFFLCVVASVIEDITPSFTSKTFQQALLLIGTGILSIVLSNKMAKRTQQRFEASCVQESLSRMPHLRHALFARCLQQKLRPSRRPSLVPYSLYMKQERLRHLKIPNFVPYSLYLEGLKCTIEQGRHI